MHSRSSLKVRAPTAADSHGSSLPPLVAAALLLTVGYAPPPAGALPASLHAAGRVPSVLCHFAGRKWTGEWEGDRSGIMMTPISGERVRFAPPPGYAHLCDAVETITAKLSLALHAALNQEALDPAEL